MNNLKKALALLTIILASYAVKAQGTTIINNSAHSYRLYLIAYTSTGSAVAVDLYYAPPFSNSGPLYPSSGAGFVFYNDAEIVTAPGSCTVNGSAGQQVTANFGWATGAPDMYTCTPLATGYTVEWGATGSTTINSTITFN